MEYLFYSVVVVCVSVIIYKIIYEYYSMVHPEPLDPEELMEAQATVEAQNKQIEYLQNYSNRSDEELRILQKKFIEIAEVLVKK